MPIPTRKIDETRDDFISRCIEELKKFDPEKPTDQIVAICEKQFDDSIISSWGEQRKKWGLDE